MTIKVKRVYAGPSNADGYRVLADRLWPRGLTKEAARVDLWLRPLAPTTELRRWFGHDVGRWEQFRARYLEELAAHGELLELIRDLERRHGTVTLLFAAKDETHNQARVLADVLRERAAARTAGAAAAGAIGGARYAHTNLIARDWRALAAFYEAVFGCTPVPPERAYSGPRLEALTGVLGAALQGVHLRLPGAGEGGPTLEVFQYDPLEPGPPPAVNRPGLAHIAFAVGSVEQARDAVLAGGGAAVGEIAVFTTATGARVTACYVTDPEGNIIELQSWDAAPAGAGGR